MLNRDNIIHRKVDTIAAMIQYLVEFNDVDLSEPDLLEALETAFAILFQDTDFYILVENNKGVTGFGNMPSIKATLALTDIMMSERNQPRTSN